MVKNLSLFAISVLLIYGCRQQSTKASDTSLTSRLPVILDTDANNELDDQHAMAYLFFNSDIFDIRGVTVNVTFGGGNIDQQAAEAERVMKLCEVHGKIPLLKGAEKNFNVIRESIEEENFDGDEAVNFIIDQVKTIQPDTLVLLPVGKLTNIALALLKAPEIMETARIVWLGSNYPHPGEYNLNNDTSALQYILGQPVQFEMVMVRYGIGSGTDDVRVTPQMMQENMAGKGPQVQTPVAGRHGGHFSNFGDYSINLFEHINLDGDPPSRALFDMVAVAILKEPEWGQSYEHPAPVYFGDRWVEQPNNSRKITIWENFDKENILQDFFGRMSNPQLAN